MTHCDFTEKNQNYLFTEILFLSVSCHFFQSKIFPEKKSKLIAELAEELTL
jgi:hypothetical protein